MIVTKACFAAAAFMGIGALTGAVIGVVQENGRVQRSEAMRAKLLPLCAQTPVVRTALLTFAAQSRAHKGLLGQLGRRIESLLSLSGRLNEADPDTVNPRVTTAAYKMQDAIALFMTDFFVASNIPMVRSVSAPGIRVPVNRDLQDSAQALLSLVDAVVYNISIMVKAKMEEAIAQHA